MPSNHLILCHPFSCPQFFAASGSFPVSWFFVSVGQSIGPSASVLPINIQSWFPLGLTGLIPLLSKGLSRVFSSTTVQKHQFFGVQSSLCFNSHICTWLVEKPKLWLHGPFVGKVMSLLFNMLSRLVIAFLPRSKYLLISRSPYTVIFCFHFFLICLLQRDGTECHDLSFLASTLFLINYFNWKLITLQYYSGFCHTFTWISQIIPPSPSPTESKSLFFISVSLLLSHI